MVVEENAGRKLPAICREEYSSLVGELGTFFSIPSYLQEHDRKDQSINTTVKFVTHVTFKH